MTGSLTELVAEPTSNEHRYADVEQGAESTTPRGERASFSSPPCQGDCQWDFLLYNETDLREDTYTEPTSIVVQRLTEAETVRVVGLVDGNARNVQITDTRDVRLGVISTTTTIDGREVTDEDRERNSDLPARNQNRVVVSLTDEQTGEPINLKERDGEVIDITDGENEYTVETGADGNATLDVNKTTSVYRYEYKPRGWWNVPKTEQAYVSEGQIFSASTQPYTTRGAFFELLQFVFIIAMPVIVASVVLRAFGLGEAAGDIVRTALDGWFP
jgi:hypothetical protein